MVKGSRHKPESLAKMRESRKEVFARPGYYRKISGAQKLAWQHPLHRRRRLAAMAACDTPPARQTREKLRRELAADLVPAFDRIISTEARV